MMSETLDKKSKYSYDPTLFKPEPPENTKLMKDLFCGRQKELERGVISLNTCADVNGLWGESHDKRIWVIHGESRAGKSHLARRVIEELPKGEKKMRLIVPARERLKASQVLKNLFEQLRSEFNSRIKTNQIGNRLSKLEKQSLDVAKDIIEKVAAFDPGTESIEITLSDSFKGGLEAGGEAGIIPSILKLCAKTNVEISEGESQTLKLRPPTPQDLSEYCSIILNTLSYLSLIDHVLILVDDVDLLEGYRDESHNAQMERSILSDSLSVLHRTPCVDVVLTSRSWYRHFRSEYQTLVDLENSVEMPIDQLVDIHDRRCKAFCFDDLPEGFLSRQALESAAQDVHGMPGVFLQHLDTAFRAYQDEDDWGERDYEWYLGVFERLYDRLRNKCPNAASAIESTVEDGGLHINVRDNNPFYQTVFENEFVFQSYYQETTYYMDSLLYKIILKRNKPQNEA